MPFGFFMTTEITIIGLASNVTQGGDRIIFEEAEDNYISVKIGNRGDMY